MTIAERFWVQALFAPEGDNVAPAGVVAGTAPVQGQREGGAEPAPTGREDAGAGIDDDSGGYEGDGFTGMMEMLGEDPEVGIPEPGTPPGGVPTAAPEDEDASTGAPAEAGPTQGAPKEPAAAQEQPTQPDPAKDPAQPAPPPQQGQEGGQPGSQPAGDQQPRIETPTTLLSAIVNNRDGLLDHYASSMFQLSDDEVAGLQEDAGAAIPRLLARVHLETLQAATAMVANTVPALLNQTLEARASNTQAVEAFYTSYPELKEHRADVSKTAIVLRQMNPDMPAAEFQVQVAKMVAAMKGVQLSGTGGQPAPAPATPPKTNGQVSAAPFAPASSGPGGGTPPAASQFGEWDVPLPGSLDE